LTSHDESMTKGNRQARSRALRTDPATSICRAGESWVGMACGVPGTSTCESGATALPRGDHQSVMTLRDRAPMLALDSGGLRSTAANNPELCSRQQDKSNSSSYTVTHKPMINEAPTRRVAQPESLVRLALSMSLAMAIAGSFAVTQPALTCR